MVTGHKISVTLTATVMLIKAAAIFALKKVRGLTSTLNDSNKSYSVVKAGGDVNETPNEAPIADAGTAITAYVGETVYFSAEDSVISMVKL